MDFGGRGKRPAFLTALAHDLGDLIGELLMNAAIGLGVQFALGNGGSMLNAGPVANRIASGQIAHLIDESSMRVGHVKCLDEVQAWPAGRRGRRTMPDQQPDMRQWGRYVELGQVGLEMVSPIVVGVLLDR